MKTITLLKNRKIELDEKTVNNKKLLETLSSIYNNHRRYRVWYGDIETGRSWNEENDVTGKISSSTGDVALLILVHNARSFGGGALLDSAIIRIDEIDTKTTLYKHDNFHVDLVLNNADKTIVMEKNNGIKLRFDNEIKAQHYLDFMRGTRYSK